jgi:hypothetical protein
MGLIPTGSIKCAISAKEYLGSLLAKEYFGLTFLVPQLGKKFLPSPRIIKTCAILVYGR